MCLAEIGRVSSLAGKAAAEVTVGDRVKQVSLLTLDGPVDVGDWLVVHSGFALHRLDPAEAGEAQRIRSTGGQQ